MGTLECVPLRSEIALRGFDCGNASINEKVRKSFYPHLLKQSRTYQIKMQNQTVGFYSLSVMSVNLAQFGCVYRRVLFQQAGGWCDQLGLYCCGCKNSKPWNRIHHSEFRYCTGERTGEGLAGPALYFGGTSGKGFLVFG